MMINYWGSRIALYGHQSKDELLLNVTNCLIWLCLVTNQKMSYYCMPRIALFGHNKKGTFQLYWVYKPRFLDTKSVRVPVTFPNPKSLGGDNAADRWAFLLSTGSSLPQSTLRKLFQTLELVSNGDDCLTLFQEPLANLVYPNWPPATRTGIVKRPCSVLVVLTSWSGWANIVKRWFTTLLGS